MRLFFIIIVAILPALLHAQSTNDAGETRCRYRPSKEFVLSKDEKCFDITFKEGNRAFALRCWDEAVALYRAAKSCADANQHNRSEMNRRMRICRDSAEQELRRSEQLARNQFLQATASGLADDAQEVLKNYDRSMAYRLADFAGQYVAPGPNADCMQALLDTWYHQPAQAANGTRFQVPFCYQLDYDLGRNTKVRFGGHNMNRVLYAFSPSSHLLYSWMVNDMEPARTIQISPEYKDFDMSPDGGTGLMFSDKDVMLLRIRSNRFTDVYKINISNLKRYCFSAHGTEFLYYDAVKSEIYMLRLSDAYKQRKGEQRAEPTLLFTDIPFEVLGMAYSKGRVWLGGRDSLVVLEQKDPTKKDTKWTIAKSLPWKTQFTYASDLKLFPGQQTAVFTNMVGAVYVPFEVKDDLPQRAGDEVLLDGMPLAINRTGNRVAHAKAENDLLYLLESSTGIALNGTYLQPQDRFAPLNGDFSHDNKWFAAVTDTGTLKMWSLVELQRDNARAIGDEESTLSFSRDDKYFFELRLDSVDIYPLTSPDQPLMTIENLPENRRIAAVGKQWVAYHSGDNNLTLRNAYSGKTIVFPTSGMEPHVAIDDSDKWVAITTMVFDTIEVYSLESGILVARLPLNGYVSSMDFIPGTRDLMIVQARITELGERQYTAKIWRPDARAEEQLRTLRIHGYNISHTDFSARGDRVAFSDRNDIRVFLLDNLLDENIRIKPLPDRFVMATAFHPDGSAIAAGYDDGQVVVWDLRSGEPRFRLSPGDHSRYITGLSFSPDASRIYIKTGDTSLIYRDIDPDHIREKGQTEYLRLVAFTPEQIRQYGLENALDYSGNFQKLAESNDLPLIRSFFEYYRLQALSSNNIEQVKRSFDSALRLYSKLDDPVTQRALRPTMQEIYEDYIWKLLLRERNEEAAKMVDEYNRVFEKPLAALKSGAHVSLMRGDLKAATLQYAEWTIRMFENPATRNYFEFSLDSLTQHFVQMSEYNLLKPEQVNCLCGLFYDVLHMEKICRLGGHPEQVPFDIDTRLRWNIFKNLYTSSDIVNHSVKVRKLESAYNDASILYKRNPGVWRGQLERTILSLVSAYSDQASFEQENVVSVGLYRKALHLLDTFGVFNKVNENTRLKALTSINYKIGNYYLGVQNLSDAVRNFERGLVYADQLVSTAATDSVDIYKNDYLAPLYYGIGMSQVLRGKAREAGESLQKAYDAYTFGLFPYIFGYIDLLKGNNRDAQDHFKTIRSSSQLGEAMAFLERMAAMLPEHREKLMNFIPEMQSIVLSENYGVKKLESGYWYALQKSTDASNRGQWKDALRWNEECVEVSYRMLGQPEPPDWLYEQYLGALLSKSFYLLYTGKNNPEAYDKVIEVVQSAKEYARKEFPYYDYMDWFDTNLGHAYLLRHGPGDQTTAINIYKEFIDKSHYGQDNWELLQKDFRDLHRAGIVWPDLKEVVLQIKPSNIELSEQDWKDMGVEDASRTEK
ncbi:MAG: WD40 repeat domain-containing protein [Saprospiraceae bacterium]|nr:WD40 repeat domain-containing protein [Saprospiraceae bacterium]